MAVPPSDLVMAPHPRERAELIGHRAATEAIADGIQSGRLHHAWLIGGPKGTGKATLAYRVARHLLASPEECTDEVLGVDATSRTARLVAAGAHPNLVTLDLESASADADKGQARSVPVKTVRRALALFSSTSTDGGHRVCIVDSAEDLTVQAANALLKTIEEPPARSTVLIVAHEPQRVLPTIRSRCRKLNLTSLSSSEVMKIISSFAPELEAGELGTLKAAVAQSDGSVGRALDLLDPQRLALLQEVAALLALLPNPPMQRVLSLGEKLSQRGGESGFDLTLDAVQRWASDRIRNRAALGAHRLAPLAELCDKVADAARAVETYNLDRRPFVLSMFGDLAEVIRDTA